jgi:flavoprotein
MLERAINRLWTRRDAPDLDVHLETCAMCSADFVNPVDWEPVDDKQWWMLLRCGACDTWREVTVPNAVAARFDLELDRRLDVVRRAFDRLERTRMSAEVETMIEALRRGLVDPADFAR